MRGKLYIFRGREFSLSEIKIIKKVIEDNQVVVGVSVGL